MNKLTLVLIIIALTSCKGNNDLNDSTFRSLSNSQATPATQELYKNLQIWQKDYTMIGHQDDLAYGVEWKYEYNRSDIHDIINDYPAVLGWDLGGIELKRDKNLDDVPFDSMRVYMQRGHEWGSINTISWHLRNPATGGSSWDTSRAISSVLPNGANHELYKSWLSLLADFLETVKDKEGNLIPILFRPYHELTGHWFWWCKPYTDPQEFKTFWQYTYDYLVKERNLHHLIFVYNTTEFQSKEAFLEFYPGDEWVDMLSFDAYQHGDNYEGFVEMMSKRLKIMNEIGLEKNMPTAIAETGYEAIPDSTWFTKVIQPILDDNPTSYILFWRNHGWQESTQKMHYYMPHKGHLSANDFMEWMKQERMISAKDLKKLAQ